MEADASKLRESTSIVREMCKRSLKMVASELSDSKRPCGKFRSAVCRPCDKPQVSLSSTQSTRKENVEILFFCQIKGMPFI